MVEDGSEWVAAEYERARAELAAAPPGTRRYRRLVRVVASLSPLVRLADEARRLRAERDTARELGVGDAELAAEADRVGAKLAATERALADRLARWSRYDQHDVVLRIFTTWGSSRRYGAELVDIIREDWMRDGERYGWRVRTLDAAPDGTDMTLAFEAREHAAGPWARLREETGIHQSKPFTTRSGRRAIAYAGVVALPDDDSPDPLPPRAVRIETAPVAGDRTRYRALATHQVSGAHAYGLAATPERAAAHALRTVRAYLLAAAAGANECGLPPAT